jgi:uncharacterized membrane protein
MQPGFAWLLYKTDKMVHLESFEKLISTFVQWLRFSVEIMGALTIAAGSLIALTRFLKALYRNKHTDFNLVRLTLARYLALALEFQLGADILSTAIAPSWEEIGKLGAIAVIRTGLNFFLTKELAEEKANPRSVQMIETSNSTEK